MALFRQIKIYKAGGDAPSGGTTYRLVIISSFCSHGFLVFNYFKFFPQPSESA